LACHGKAEQKTSINDPHSFRVSNELGGFWQSFPCETKATTNSNILMTGFAATSQSTTTTTATTTTNELQIVGAAYNISPSKHLCLTRQRLISQLLMSMLLLLLLLLAYLSGWSESITFVASTIPLRKSCRFKQLHDYAKQLSIHKTIECGKWIAKANLHALHSTISNKSWSMDCAQ